MASHNFTPVIAGVIYALAFAKPLWAVDDEGGSIRQRLQLVGVIAESKPNQSQSGVVVLRDTESKRTHTLRAGDRISWLEDLEILSIKRNRVEVGHGDSAHVLITYSGSSDEEQNDGEPSNEQRMVNQVRPEHFSWPQGVETEWHEAIDPETLQKLYETREFYRHQNDMEGYHGLKAHWLNEQRHWQADEGDQPEPGQRSQHYRSATSPDERETWHESRRASEWVDSVIEEWQEHANY